MAFTGFVRAVRGERLLGDHTRVTSDPCPTLREAEAWVALMLTSNIEAGKRVAEAGTLKVGTRGKGKKKDADDPRNNTDAENERTEREAETAKPRRRTRKAPGHRSADHTPAARAHAE